MTCPLGVIAGVLVSVANVEAFAFHCKDGFNAHYNQYRSDVDADAAYIRTKHAR